MAFDLVFPLEEELNTAKLELEDFAKLSTLAVLRSFKNAVYISPKSVVVRNVDEIFDEFDDDLEKGGRCQNFILPKSGNLSVFLVKPSWALFDILRTGLIGMKNGNPASIKIISSFCKKMLKIRGGLLNWLP